MAVTRSRERAGNENFPILEVNLLWSAILKNVEAHLGDFCGSGGDYRPLQLNHKPLLDLWSFNLSRRTFKELIFTWCCLKRHEIVRIFWETQAKMPSTCSAGKTSGKLARADWSIWKSEVGRMVPNSADLGNCWHGTCAYGPCRNNTGHCLISNYSDCSAGNTHMASSCLLSIAIHCL